MSFSTQSLAAPRPDSIRTVTLPRRQPFHPSPADWRDEIIYFLLVDRFSDAQEGTRPLLDPTKRTDFRPAGFRWDQWSGSGSGRYQGGTLKGVASKLDYIASLGATTLWVSPIFKQRAHTNDYHGYAIQDYLEVDPRIGTRQDLVDLVTAAHAKNNARPSRRRFQPHLRKLFYDLDLKHRDQPQYLPWPNFYPKGPWRDREGNPTTNINGPDDGVWPTELTPDDYYTRAGEGDLGAGDINDPHAEFRRTDFDGDRDLNYDLPSVLDDIARCYKYWIALTDCDGFRIDTLKHIDEGKRPQPLRQHQGIRRRTRQGRLLLVGEVAGSNFDADFYLKILGSNLNATLDIGEIRPTLVSVAKGLTPPDSYFTMAQAWDDDLGSHRNSGKRHVSILDDHDCVSGTKTRFSADAPTDHQVVAGVAMQLFGLGIPCIYYGTEQAFAGPEADQRQFLTNYGGNDAYLREAMFGPEHPRFSGLAGLAPGAAGFDPGTPGFGPFGTTGAHCFNPSAAAYVRIAALIAIRAQFPSLRYGRQYQRALGNFGADFTPPPTRGVDRLVAHPRRRGDPLHRQWPRHRLPGRRCGR